MKYLHISWVKISDQHLIIKRDFKNIWLPVKVMTPLFDDIHSPEEFAEWISAFEYDTDYNKSLSKDRWSHNGKSPCRSPETLINTGKGICVEFSNMSRLWLTRNSYWNQILYYQDANDHHFICVFRYPGNNDDLYILGDSRCPGEIQGPFKDRDEIGHTLKLNFVKEVKLIPTFSG